MAAKDANNMNYCAIEKESDERSAQWTTNMAEPDVKI